MVSWKLYAGYVNQQKPYALRVIHAIYFVMRGHRNNALGTLKTRFTIQLSTPPCFFCSVRTIPYHTISYHTIRDSSFLDRASAFFVHPYIYSPLCATKYFVYTINSKTLLKDVHDGLACSNFAQVDVSNSIDQQMTVQAEALDKLRGSMQQVEAKINDAKVYRYYYNT